MHLTAYGVSAHLTAGVARTALPGHIASVDEAQGAVLAALDEHVGRVGTALRRKNNRCRAAKVFVT